MAGSSILIVGGTGGLGRDLAEALVARGDAVTIAGRDDERAAAVAAELGPGVGHVAVDLTQPSGIAAALAGLGPLDHVVLTAIERDANSVRDFAIDRATRLVTLKLVGYTAVVHALLDRIAPRGSVLLYGGLAKERPYPGSTTVSTINGGVSGLARTMAYELAPIRVNAVHPGIVGDSPFWADKPAALESVRRTTPIGRPVTMREVTEAAVTLLDNEALNAVELPVDGGWLLGWSEPAR